MNLFFSKLGSTNDISLLAFFLSPFLFLFQLNNFYIVAVNEITATKLTHFIITHISWEAIVIYSVCVYCSLNLHINVQIMLIKQTGQARAHDDETKRRQLLRELLPHLNMKSGD